MPYRTGQCDRMDSGCALAVRRRHRQRHCRQPHSAARCGIPIHSGVVRANITARARASRSRIQRVQRMARQQAPPITLPQHARTVSGGCQWERRLARGHSCDQWWGRLATPTYEWTTRPDEPADRNILWRRTHSVDAALQTLYTHCALNGCEWIGNMERGVFWFVGGGVFVARNRWRRTLRAMYPSLCPLHYGPLYVHNDATAAVSRQGAPPAHPSDRRMAHPRIHAGDKTAMLRTQHVPYAHARLHV